MKATQQSQFRSRQHSKDPIGQAVQLFWTIVNQTSYQAAYGSGYEIRVMADLLDDDTIPVNYLFRTWEDMPDLERMALDLCHGRVLDVGAAAGCHSIILQERGFDVSAIDTSKGSVAVMQERGLKAECADIFQYKSEQPFDTILLLMNGLGMAGTFSKLPEFLQAIKNLLKPGGQILIDSSDLKEYAEDFAEIRYQMHFKNTKSAIFPWLFLPYEKSKTCLHEHGLQAELIHQAEDGSYLMRVI